MKIAENLRKILKNKYLKQIYKIWKNLVKPS